LNFSSYFLIIFLSLLVSCAGPVEESYDDISSNVVDLDSSSSEKAPPTIGSESDVSAVGVGPKPIGPNRVGQDEKNPSVWALVLSPGLNRVICHAVAVRALYEKGIRFNIITGSGMGSIVAAYLAQGTTPEIIEWRFHKFFQKSEGMKPFSKNWIERVEKDLLKDFEGKKIQNTKITLLVPVYNELEKKVDYLRRGDLHKSLLENVNLRARVPGKANSVIVYDKLDSSKLISVGAQKIVEIDALGRKVKFEGSADYLFGIYGRWSSVPKEQNENHYLMELPIADFSLDSTKDLPEYLRMSYLYVRDNSVDIKENYLSRN
tara:strand:- start:244733 stop:245689 length:957 start_codon:yes stop_codon:yes gene_type:complete